MEKIEIYIPKEKLHELDNVKHQSGGREWVKIVYYEKKKLKESFPDEVVDVYSRCEHFKKNCFYKVTQLSKKDDNWDYYRKLKNFPTNTVGKLKNNSYKKKEPKLTFYYPSKPIKVYFD